MAKKKQKPTKRVWGKLPVPHDCELPEEIVVAAVPIDPAKAEPLVEVSEPISGTAYIGMGFKGAYIWFQPDEGQKMPDISEDGARVKVQFSPPVG